MTLKLTSWAHNVGEGRVTTTAQALAICVLPHKRPHSKTAAHTNIQLPQDRDTMSAWKPSVSHMTREKPRLGT